MWFYEVIISTALVSLMVYAALYSIHLQIAKARAYRSRKRRIQICG